MSEIKAAVIQGDGVGPEMIRPALELLKKYGLDGEGIFRKVRDFVK